MSSASDVLDAALQMKGRGFSQRAIASLLGVSRSTVSGYLTGRHGIREARAEKSLQHYRDTHGKVSEKVYEKGELVYKVERLPATLSVRSDMEAFQKRHPNADGFALRQKQNGVWKQTHVRPSAKEVMMEATEPSRQHGKSQWKLKIGYDEDDGGVEFVAVYLS